MVKRADQVLEGEVVIEPVSQKRVYVAEVQHLDDRVFLGSGGDPGESTRHGFWCHRDQVLVAYHWTELIDEEA
jgi:hypothetical protein